MTAWRTTDDGRWIECDPNGGAPLPGARPHDRLPELRGGDTMAADDVARQLRQAGGEQPLDARIRDAKAALYGERQSPGTRQRIDAAKRAMRGER